MVQPRHVHRQRCVWRNHAQEEHGSDRSSRNRGRPRRRRGSACFSSWLRPGGWKRLLVELRLHDGRERRVRDPRGQHLLLADTRYRDLLRLGVLGRQLCGVAAHGHDDLRLPQRLLVTMQLNTLARAATILGIAAALAGCSSSTPSAPATSVDVVAGGMAEAKAAGADPSQIELFADGAISYSAYETAINRYAACARDAGYTVTITGTRASQGVTVLNYAVAVPTGKTIDLADAC